MNGLNEIVRINEQAAFRAQERKLREREQAASPAAQKRQRVAESQYRAKFSRGS